MEKPGNQEETVVENQQLAVEEKMKKLFGHINPNQLPEVCPIRDVLSPVTDKWSLLIIIFLGNLKVLRFNELKRYIIGISSKILAERLKRLERDGYVSRKMYPEVPIRVEYRLTPFGLQYLNHVLVLTEWIEGAMPDIIQKRLQFDKLLKPTPTKGEQD